jgi:hypothetical protein
MKESIFLGSCKYEPMPHVRVAPIAIVEGGAWKIDAQWTEILPDQGTAFSPRHPGFSMGEFFTFIAIENLHLAPNKPDRYLVTNAHRIDEVRDYRATDTEVARRDVVEIGLTGLYEGTERVIIALKDGVCTIVPLVNDPDTGRKIAALSNLQNLATYEFDQSLFTGDKINAKYIAIPGITVGTQVGTVDWSRDADFFEGALNRLRRIRNAVLQENENVLPHTKAQIRSLISTLSRANILSDASAELGPIRDRLLTLSNSINTNIEATSDIIELICDLTPIKERLEAELSSRIVDMEYEVRADLERTLRKEIEGDLKPLANTRTQLITENDELASLIRNRRTELTTLESEIFSLNNSLTTEISSIQNNLTQLPAAALDVARALSTRIITQVYGSSHHIELIPAQASPWTRAGDRPPVNFSEWGDFTGALKKGAIRSGFDTDALLIADIAARAGELVVIPSLIASDIVQCSASIISSGEVYRHILDPSTIGLEDIWRQPISSIPTAFAHAWISASANPTRFKILFIEGLERTPMDMWLPSLVNELDRDSRPSNLLVFASLGKKNLDPARTWESISDNVTPISLDRSPGLDADALARVMGTPNTVSAFNAQTKPHPDPEAISKILTSSMKSTDRKFFKRALRTVSAGWPHKNETELNSLIESYCTILDGQSSADQRCIAVAEGRKWLLLQLGSNTQPPIEAY